MSKVNLDAVSEHVSTQYGDLTGVIQIDGHSNISSIYALSKDHNFDTDDKFIVGFGMGEHTLSGIGERDEVYCTIYYVLKSEYGNTFEAIEAKIRRDGLLRVRKKNLTVKYSKLGKYIKRYDFISFTQIARGANEIQMHQDD